MPRTRATRILRRIAGASPLAQRIVRETRVDDGFDGRAIPGHNLDWRTWQRRMLPDPHRAAPAEHHEDFWDWIEAFRPREYQRPFIAPWPRGGAKSTTAEEGVGYIGANLTRRFVLYVCKTQKLADEHVQNVASVFSRLGIGNAVSKLGHSVSWRRDQLRTENGFNVAAIGLDRAVRGIKIENFRPDLIIFDDIDDVEDSPKITAKKKRAITQNILPAGAPWCATAFVQNVILDGGLMSQLCEGKADFLLDRLPARIIPAAHDLVVEPERVEGSLEVQFRVRSGRPTWEGQSLSIIERQINLWGWGAFEREALHRVRGDGSGLWKRSRDIDPYRWSRTELDALLAGKTWHVADLRVGVAVDPSGSAKGDEVGIVAGIAARIEGKWHGFIVEDATDQLAPSEWATQTVAACLRWGATVIVAEKNFGGEMVEAMFDPIDDAPKVVLVHASRGKEARAQPVQREASFGRVHHVGAFDELEHEMTHWTADKRAVWSPNRMDAAVWLLTHLMDLGVAEESDEPVARAFVGSGHLQTSGQSLGPGQRPQKRAPGGKSRPTIR